jgi:hypothetical protein
MRGIGGRSLGGDLSHLGGVVASVVEQVHGRILVTGDANGQWRWAAHRLKCAFEGAGGDVADLRRFAEEIIREVTQR